MNIEEAVIKINREEANELLFALSYKIKHEIETHWLHLQQSNNTQKRKCFFAYEKQKLKILKELCCCLNLLHVYDDVIYHLDTLIPKSDGVQK
jgi:hypothetical protein